MANLSNLLVILSHSTASFTSEFAKGLTEVYCQQPVNPDTGLVHQKAECAILYGIYGGSILTMKLIEEYCPSFADGWNFSGDNENKAVTPTKPTEPTEPTEEFIPRPLNKPGASSSIFNSTEDTSPFAGQSDDTPSVVVIALNEQLGAVVNSTENIN